MKKTFLIVCVALGVIVVAFWASRGDRPTDKPMTMPVSRVLIEKQKHTLTLLAGETPVRTYQIALGSGGLEAKQFEGDKRTPEGKYLIDYRNENSGYHRSLHISYPSPADAQRAAQAGKKPGGDIMIHGIRNGLGGLGALHRRYDWTAGCIAVTDEEIEEIWQLVKDGTPVEIKP